jgi:hypothetical protein
MKEHKINSTDSFIQGWYLDSSFCEDLVNFYNTQCLVQTDGVLLNNNTSQIKESLDIIVPPHNISLHSYFIQLKTCLDYYNNKFNYSSGLRGYSIKENVNIQHYPVSGGYKVWHCERASADIIIRDRHLVFMTYLNDVDDGGTEFFHQKITIRAEKGLTLIWPADWTHVHRGQISTTKEKIIITGWLSYN